MKINKEVDEYLRKWIEEKIPKHLQSHYSEIIGAMKAGFYKGIEFEQRKKSNKRLD